MHKRIGSLLAAVCAMLLVAAPAEAKHDGYRHRGGPPPSAGDQTCDPIDPSLCMLPWPDNFFTRPDRSTPTGLRLNISPAATPRDVAGVPIDPTDWNRLDGFSPGSPIVTHVPGMDNPQAFANTHAPTNIDIQRSLDRDSPIVVIDATTGRRWPVWAELDRSLDLNGNAPSPARTALIIHPARNLAEGHRYIVALRDLRDADGHVISPQSPFAQLVSGHGRPLRARALLPPQHLPAARARGHLAPVAVSGVGLHRRQPPEPHRPNPVHAQRRPGQARRQAAG
jgi:hypothetical protein